MKNDVAYRLGESYHFIRNLYFINNKNNLKLKKKKKVSSPNHFLLQNHAIPPSDLEAEQGSAMTTSPPLKP